VTLVSGVWRSAFLWAVASNERAVANARAAATECSRLRVERAEVEQFLSDWAGSTADVAEKAVSTGG
jgi:hypothetical protein